MYSPGKNVRLETLSAPPKLENLKAQLALAVKNRGALVQQPWRSERTNQGYNLTVQTGYGAVDPIWTLYGGDGSQEHVLWSQRFDDVELAFDVLNMSVRDQEQSQPFAFESEPKFEEPPPPTPEPEVAAPPPPAIAEPEPEPQSEPVTAEAPKYEEVSLPEPEITKAVTEEVPVEAPQASMPLIEPEIEPKAAGEEDYVYSATQGSDLLKKRPNILLGRILVEAGLIPEATLNAALQLQEMVRKHTLSVHSASEALRRAHTRGGELDRSVFSAGQEPGDLSAARDLAPPLGELLVGAGLIPLEVLKAALNLQDAVRSGALSKQDALVEFVHAYFGQQAKPEAKFDPVVDLLKQAGIINEKDFEAASNVRKKHGGELPKILIAAGKLDNDILEQAATAKEMIDQEQLKIEQAIIALHYCMRMRVSLKESITELGY